MQQKLPTATSMLGHLALYADFIRYKTHSWIQATNPVIQI